MTHSQEKSQKKLTCIDPNVWFSSQGFKRGVFIMNEKPVNLSKEINTIIKLMGKVEWRCRRVSELKNKSTTK